MKKPHSPLALVDVSPDLNAELVARLHRIATIRKLDWWRRGSNGQMVFVRDWRDIAARCLRKSFPRGWVYCGGRHVALHASPPRFKPRHKHTRATFVDGEAGHCLCRIVELLAGGATES